MHPFSMQWTTSRMARNKRKQILKTHVPRLLNKHILNTSFQFCKMPRELPVLQKENTKNVESPMMAGPKQHKSGERNRKITSQSKVFIQCSSLCTSCSSRIAINPEFSPKNALQLIWDGAYPCNSCKRYEAYESIINR